MSFGFSLGDLATLVALTKKTHDGWREAPKEYRGVVRTLRESNMLLCHVERRFDTLTGAETNAGKQKEIGDLLRGCQETIIELRTVAKRRRKLGHWDRIRLGTSHVDDCRNRLARHLNILTPFLFSLELESIGKDIASVPATLDRLPQVLSNALPAALGKMIDQRIEDARTTRGSIMTTYADDDDKQAYKELRRNLRFFGINDSVVREQRTKLVEFIRTLTHEDHDTVIGGADGTEQVSEGQTGPNQPPTPIPKVLHTAQGVETVYSEIASTTPNRRYQAYVETEDEDEYVESVAAMSRNDKSVSNSGKTRVSMGDFEHDTHNGDSIEVGAGDKPKVTKSANTIPCCAGGTTAIAGRRKHQAYVETEDEDDVLETPRTAMDDLPIPPVCSVPPSQARRAVPPQASSGDAGQSNIDMKADGTSKDTNRTSTKTGRPATPRKPKPSTVFAACGDPECQKRLISPLRSEGAISVSNRVLCDCYCSSSEQQSDSDGDESWEHPSDSDDRNSSDTDQQSEVDEHASKAARGGAKDGEEGRPKRHDEKSSTSSPPIPEQEEITSRRNRFKQRLIEYEPLDVTQEGPLTIQLGMPSGYSVHIEGGRFAMFHDRRAPSSSRQYFRSLPRREYHLLRNCTHEFLSARRPSRSCGCQVLYWTPELQYWNPDFLDGLRSWVMDGGVV